MCLVKVSLNVHYLVTCGRTLPGDVEALFIEVNLRNIKFLLVGTYHPPSQTDQYYFEFINNALDLYAGTYEKVFMAGDFNAQVTEKCEK